MGSFSRFLLTYNSVRSKLTTRGSTKELTSPINSPIFFYLCWTFVYLLPFKSWRVFYLGRVLPLTANASNCNFFNDPVSWNCQLNIVLRMQDMKISTIKGGWLIDWLIPCKDTYWCMQTTKLLTALPTFWNSGDDSLQWGRSMRPPSGTSLVHLRRELCKTWVARLRCRLSEGPGNKIWAKYTLTGSFTHVYAEVRPPIIDHRWCNQSSPVLVRQVHIFCSAGKERLCFTPAQFKVL